MQVVRIVTTALHTLAKDPKATLVPTMRRLAKHQQYNRYLEYYAAVSKDGIVFCLA